jgi:hypothetical protein
LTIVGYYVPQTLLRHEGIRRRSRATAETWRELGVRTREIPIPIDSDPQTNLDLLRHHVISDSAAARQAAELFRSGELDHVHARLLAPTPAWLELARSHPVSLEIHNPLYRPESRRDLFARVILGAPTAKALLSRAQGAAFITHELADRREYRAVRKRVVVGAGKRLGTPANAPLNEVPRVGMAVGSVAQWHGLEVLARWADTLPDLQFVVICPKKILTTLEGLYRGSRLRLLPTNNQSDYRRALAGLDAAVGSLNLQAHGYGESATLKVRDYLDVGVPTLLAYPDTNLLDVTDPAVQLMPTLQDLRWVRNWVLKVRGTRVLSETRAAVSMQTIERKRLQALALL